MDVLNPSGVTKHLDDVHEDLLLHCHENMKLNSHLKINEAAIKNFVKEM